MIMIGAGNVASAARARAAAIKRFVHGREHGGVRPPTQVIVRATHCDRVRPVWVAICCAGAGSLVTPYIRKYSVPVFAVEVFMLPPEMCVGAYGMLPSSRY